MSDRSFDSESYDSDDSIHSEDPSRADLETNRETEQELLAAEQTYEEAK